MCLLEAGLVGEAGAGEGAALDAAEEFDPKKLVEIVKVHWRGLSERTISFDKAKIKRIVKFLQYRFGPKRLVDGRLGGEVA